LNKLKGRALLPTTAGSKPFGGFAICRIKGDPELFPLLKSVILPSAPFFGFTAGSD
jgi:hypothetical protein